MSFFKAIRWALIAEIVITQIAIAVLLELFRKEESKNYSFSLLVNKYQEKLYWHIRKLLISHDDTDDVLQNTFVKIWINLSNFREESQLFTWMYKIASNEALGFLRKKSSWATFSFSSVEDYLKQSLRSDPYFKGDEIQLKLQEAILELPEKQRLVFNMRYFDEMTYDEISSILDTSVGALKASYHHAAKKIEEKMLNHL